MIVGIGCDIIRMDRIAKSLEKYGERFERKIFTDNEIKFCNARKNKAESFAKMFALKEATIKAISDTRGMKWKDMEVKHLPSGKPIMELSGNAHRNLTHRLNGANFNLEVSVSDDIPYACAFVIIEST